MSESYPDLNLTNFPENIDTFMQWLNITATDGLLIAQYQNAIETGNTTLANQILSQIPSGTQKIIKATDLNQLTQALLAVERFYLTDIQPYIENQQENWLSVINQFSYKGTWSIGSSYEVNNLVTYTVSGLTLVYIATSTPPVGTVPTNNNYWRLLTIQGQQGTSGQGLSYRQEWNVSANYQINDSVTYNNALWMAIQSSVGQSPSDSSQYWQKIMNLEVTTYPIQDTQPENQTVNSLWLNTSNSPTDYYYLEPLTNPIEVSMIPIGYQTYDTQGQVLDGQGPLPITSGGTNAIDSQNALNNLGAQTRNNLLDNFNFTNVINQKGNNSYISTGGITIPIIDRWNFVTGTFTVNSNNVSWTSGGVIFQKINGVNLADGKLRTVSYFDTNGNCYYGNLTNQYTTIGDYKFSYADGIALYVQATSTSSGMIFIKLEEGDTQTLGYQDSDGTWKLLPQPDMDYTTQLLRCQRYQVYNASSAYFRAAYVTTNAIGFNVPIPGTLRTNPAFDGSPTVQPISLSGAISGFTFAYYSYPGYVRVVATKSAHGLSDAVLVLPAGMFNSNL